MPYRLIPANSPALAISWNVIRHEETTRSLAATWTTAEIPSPAGYRTHWAQSILSSINACTSVSISGCGIRFFCLGKLPEGLNKVVGHGPEDITIEAMTSIIKTKPNIRDKIAKGEPAWNCLEIYESGPRHLTITGEWLPGYPEDLPNRTSELLQVINPFLEKETPKETPRPIPVQTESSSTEDRGDKLPFLSILQIIDVSEFANEGDELVGPHPVFGSSTGSNLKVNISKNAWY